MLTNVGLFLASKITQHFREPQRGHLVRIVNPQDKDHQEDGDKLQHLSAHYTILFLKHSFALPKLLYNLRTSPCFLSLALREYDNLLKSIMSGITNIHFGEDCPTWLQATLPVKVEDMCSSSALVYHIVSPALQGSPMSNWEDAMDIGLKATAKLPPRRIRSALAEELGYDEDISVS